MAQVQPEVAATPESQLETKDDIDEEIAYVRQQSKFLCFSILQFADQPLLVQELTKRKHFLCKTLINSTAVRKQLNEFPELQDASVHDSAGLPIEDDPLATEGLSPDHDPSPTDVQHLTNVYRLAFGVTTFPFTDPSPNSTARFYGRLLGIRFDQCSRDGKFQAPYYILLRRIQADRDEWQIHRHTIPAFISLDVLEQEYLLLRDGEDNAGTLKTRDFEDESIHSDTGGSRTRQDLQGFARKVRYELTSWKLRLEAIDYLRKQLNLIDPAFSDQPTNPRTAIAQKAGRGTTQNDEKRKKNDHGYEDQDMTEPSDDENSISQGIGFYGILSIEPTAFEARQARITWTDGTIARIKINNQGTIERAVVVGEQGRIRGVENLLVDGESRIEELLPKLKKLVGES